MMETMQPLGFWVYLAFALCLVVAGAFMIVVAATFYVWVWLPIFQPAKFRKLRDESLAKALERREARRG